MKQRYLIIPLLMFFAMVSLNALAQQNVSGTIKDARGTALPGVNVIVKGTSVGTVSDADGKYTLAVPDNSGTLVFSFIGFVSKEVSIGGQSSIDVALDEDVKQLNEVVVTALGIERSTKALQSSVTQISGDNFTQARELNVTSQLEGRVAGVNVTKIASGPAGSTRVVIRGAKSLATNTNNQPLYVVDGIPMDNTQYGQSGVWGGADQGDGMNSISPDDIASMTVLKGAASAALYGARAANGVILITTKKGNGRKGIGIEYNSNYVFEKLVNYTDFQHSNGSGALVGTDEATRVATKATPIAANPGDPNPAWTTAFNQGWNSQAWGPRFDGSPVVQMDGQTRPYSYAGDNWKRFYQTGTTATNTIAMSGGSDTQNFRFSMSNLNNKGVIPATGFDRVNLTLATSSKFGKKVTLTSKVMYSNESAKNRPTLSDSPGNAIQAMYVIPGDANVNIYKGDPNKLGAVPVGLHTPDGKNVGEEFQPTSNLWGQNPYWAAYQFTNTDVRDRILASAKGRYDITDFLYVEGQGGIDWSTKRSIQLTPQGTGYQLTGGMNQSEYRVRETNYQFMVGFDKGFGKLHTSGYFGGNRMRNTYEFMQINGTGFNVPFFQAITNVQNRNFNYDFKEKGINSEFASAEVSWDNYLYVTGTWREDWFSTLSPEVNHIPYGSIGGSFVFTDALKSVPTWLSFGKLRASWGEVGNANVVDPYSTKFLYSLGQSHLNKPTGYINSVNQTYAGNFPNPKLIPYTSTEVEFGLDARFLQNRLGIDFTYYSQSTRNDILNQTVSRSSGYNSTSVNLGQLTNKGVEILITGTPITGPVKWDVSLNFARNVNNVVSLVAGQTQVWVEEPRTRTVAVQHIIGHPFGMLTGLVQQKTPDGKLVYNPDGQPVSDGSYQILGNGVPKFTGGLTNTVSYKGINLSMLIDFKYGGQIYSGTNVRQDEAGFTKQTLLGRQGEAPLTVTGAVVSGTDGSGNTTYSDFTKTLTPGEAQNYWANIGEKAENRYVYDASFIKLRQLTIGYSIPKSMLTKTPFQTLMISAVGRNLGILYKRTPNIDPESSYTNSNAQGLDYYGMPPSRTYGFNLRATF